ncbi:MAG TPA: hypothetical protein VEW46_13160, partial [Pyrinomonadaceae bacterium]|nr:hypothetical protein [Pyrinomonadaceae bacterium]
MAKPSDETPSVKVPGKTVGPLLLSREFRWLYILVVVFLRFVGLALSAVGISYLTTWWKHG